MIRRCAAFVNAHLSRDRLRFPKRRAPLLTARCLFFNTLLDACKFPRHNLSWFLPARMLSTLFWDVLCLEVVSQPRITPDGKAQAHSNAQQPPSLQKCPRILYIAGCYHVRSFHIRSANFSPDCYDGFGFNEKPDYGFMRCRTKSWSAWRANQYLKEVIG